MSDPDPCMCLAMLVADKVFREEGTGKSHIAGTFSRLGARKFPWVHDTMHVYLALTDIAPGTHACEARFTYLDDDAQLLSAKSEIKSDDKLQVIEINYCFRRAAFPRPGELEIAFYMDDQYVMRRKFVVARVGKPGRGPEPGGGAAPSPPDGE